MKKLFFLILVFFSVSTAFGQVNYDIEADRDEAVVNASVLLSCEEGDLNCPVNQWTLDWRVPENSEVLELSDSQGVIDDYSRVGDSVEIETNSGPRRKEEKVDISVRMDQGSERVADGLYTWRIPLSGFENKVTTGSVEAGSLQSVSLRGFNTSYSGNESSFRGSGSSVLRLNFGEGNSTDYYSFFGGERKGSLAYEVSVATTGLRQSYERVPVALLPEAEYDSQVSDWSQGEYSSGVVRLRSDLGEDDFLPVLAEETTHAFNDHAFRFDETSSSWLDEGIGSYVQSLVRKKLVGEERTRTLFGNETSYTIAENGSRYRVTKPSAGDREVLWSYYQDNRSFMKDWNPRDSDADVRRFGYAYSELIVRNYVSKGNSVNNLYPRFEDESLETNEEKWSYFGNYLDLYPCRFEDRERFDSCLDRVNEYDYPVYSVEEMPERSSKSIEVEELETPNYTDRSRINDLDLAENDFVSAVLELVREFFRDLYAALHTLSTWF